MAILNISDFKNQGLRLGGARPNLFSINLNLQLEENQTLFVKAASIPPSTLETLPINYAGRVINMDGARTFDDWTVTVLNDTNFTIRTKIFNTMQQIAGKVDGTRDVATGFGATDYTYEKQSTVSQHDQAGDIIQTYTFYNMWPSSLAPIELSWEDVGLQEYDITFSYDYWEHTKQ